MDDIITALYKSGVPPSVLVLLVILYLVGDKKGWFKKREKDIDPSEDQRKMLSADEETFRRTLMRQMDGLIERCDKAEKAHMDCLEVQQESMQAHQDCRERLEELWYFASELVDKVKAAGVNLLIDLSPPAPYKGFSPKDRKEGKK